MLLGLRQPRCPDIAAGGWEGEMGMRAHNTLWFFARKDGLKQLTIPAMADNWKKVLPFNPNFNTELSRNGGT